MERIINTNTAGRYFVKGEIRDEIQVVWFVFHGYGMRADDFIEEFNEISDSVSLIVAPEGTHRFYGKGTRGDISANWMTSDLRENDIANNIDFLNSVLEDLLKQGLNKDVRISILGFSQGGPTSFRWASQLKQKVDQLIAWGTDIPKDVISNPILLQKINESGIKLVVGSKDKYISSEKVDEFIMDYHDSGLNFDFHTFEGGHEIHLDTVRYFHARMLDNKTEY